MPVEVVTLAERPVERTSEFIASVRSRRSTRVRPEVEGSITRILVRSGDTVEPGRTLLVIDHRMQEALVARLEAELLARRADLQQARQEAARTETLVEAGAASQAELEQATTTLQTGEAQLNATEAQLREQRVALSYHTVTAPTAGIVGDIPVRVGDRVTKSTLLTTIDQTSDLELYINVPVQEAPSLRLGLPVHLLDDDGSILATEKLSFISPSVEGETQSVLAKATLESAVGLRTEQFVRVRVVWSEAPALVAPVIALDRVGGQHFAYVAEDGEGGVTVARQRVVEPGAVVGNDYVIKSGLAPGDRLIVSGLQRIGDGAPVTIVPAKAEAPETVPAPRGGGD
jgi:RND family efflux transporter MFP subunit